MNPTARCGRTDSRSEPKPMAQLWAHLTGRRRRVACSAHRGPFKITSDALLRFVNCDPMLFNPLVSKRRRGLTKSIGYLCAHADLAKSDSDSASTSECWAMADRRTLLIAGIDSALAASLHSAAGSVFPLSSASCNLGPSEHCTPGDAVVCMSTFYGGDFRS